MPVVVRRSPILIIMFRIMTEEGRKKKLFRAQLLYCVSLAIACALICCTVLDKGIVISSRNILPFWLLTIVPLILIAVSIKLIRLLHGEPLVRSEGERVEHFNKRVDAYNKSANSTIAMLTGLGLFVGGVLCAIVRLSGAWSYLLSF